MQIIGSRMLCRRKYDFFYIKLNKCVMFGSWLDYLWKTRNVNNVCQCKCGKRNSRRIWIMFLCERNMIYSYVVLPLVTLHCISFFGNTLFLSRMYRTAIHFKLSAYYVKYCSWKLSVIREQYLLTKGMA